MGRERRAGERIARGKNRTRPKPSAGRVFKVCARDAGWAAMGSNGANGPKPMSNMQGGNNSWKTWQSDDDIPQRKILIQHM